MNTFTIITVMFSLLRTTASAECSRSELQETADRYLASQSTGKPGWLQTVLADNATYTENNQVGQFHDGILSQSLHVDHQRITLDTIACASYTELIVTNSVEPYIIGTQIRHIFSSNGTLKVSEIDSIVSGADAWLFNASHSLHYVLSENWSRIEPAKQDTRQIIQAAADAYLDVWSNKSVTIPWGIPCDRMEGSMYTGQGLANDTCNVGVPEGGTYPPNSNRRYVIDETVGSVNVLLTFETMSNAPDSHEFRVEGGKIRYVHTMTVCPKPNCGLDRPAILFQDIGF